MADLIAVGYWQSSDESPFPHPALLQGAGYSRETREGIASYLKSGARFASWMGWSYCRFRCGVADSALGDSDLSDGFCVWPQGLAHYGSRGRVTMYPVCTPKPANNAVGGCFAAAADAGSFDGR